MRVWFLCKDDRLNPAIYFWFLFFLTLSKTQVKGLTYKERERTPENSNSHAATRREADGRVGTNPADTRGQVLHPQCGEVSANPFYTPNPLKALEPKAPGRTGNRGRLKGGEAESLEKQLES